MIKDVLLIDDNDTQHELFRCYAFALDEIKLRHATSMQEATEKIKDSQPDIIFLDNRVYPHNDFRETIPLIRQAGFEGNIVLISSDVDQPVFKLADKFSVHSCVNKFDFTIQNFQEKLGELIRLKQHEFI